MGLVKTVVCGMSGGVDSAVTALILQRRGFNVVGAFMKNWDLTNETGCTTEGDRKDAASVCEQLNIPFHEVNFVKEYWTEVFTEMTQAYEKGHTPNPDILCNKFIKFGHFFNFAMNTLQADAVATGHYARNSFGPFLEHSNPNSSAKLLMSVDQRKDQTLFLSQMPQNALRRTMFPLGAMLKSDVKQMAVEAGLERIVQKKESMGMCFIGKRQFQDFMEDYLEPRPGPFVDLETEQVVGTHKGIHLWTKGQRTHISGMRKAYFVGDICSKTNVIHVVQGTDHPALYSRQITTEKPHWIHKVPRELSDSGHLDCSFRYQHLQPPTGCRVKLTTGGLDITLGEPLRAVAVGQYAVLYKEQECLGSSRIIQSEPSNYTIQQKHMANTS